MHDLVEVIGYINNVLYIALALVAFRSWRRRGGEAAAWVAATFASFALIGVIGLVVPEEGDSAFIDVTTKVTILAIVFFPYALYRFTSAIKRSGRLYDRLALAATVIVGVWTLFLGDLPDPGEQRSSSLQLYIVALLAQWGGLLITVAARLWRAGRGQPTLARRRMKLLSLASVGMTLALVVAGTQQSSEVNDSVDLGVQLLALTSTAFFFLAFAPPAILRMAWRRPEQEALTQATEELVRATSGKEVIDSLLPHVTRTVGARGALLASPDGTVLGTHGDVRAERGPAPMATEDDPDSDLIALEFDFGRLVMWTSPYTPFFGHEELELLRSLGILTGLALDRTELYQRERSARASLAEAQSIAHIGSFAWDVRAGTTAWSDEMYAIFGVDRSFEVTAESYYASVHPEDRKMVEDIVAKALQEKRPYTFDHRVRRPDGELRTLHARGKVETDDSGEVVRVVGTVQDVTAAREAERRVAAALASEREARKAVEDLNAEMESFVYTVSHDLNSPIIAIQGFADFLEKDYGSELPERGRFYVERIRASSGYLRSLIQDLLAFSRVGRVQTDPESVDLHEVVRHASEEVRGGCPGLQVDADGLPAVYMNPLRARQLFTNLMQNSCRYAGRPDVSVSVSSQIVDGGMVQLSVRDNGPGIPAEHRKKAFGVFERLQQESSPEGSGMGLPICRRIVETTGGTMWIEDSDIGLDIRFTLPLSRSSAAPDETVGNAG
ncbi:MAG: sensor histidine kinase [Actinomycetota bacterium]